MLKYDGSIKQLLMDNGINHKNIVDWAETILKCHFISKYVNIILTANEIEKLESNYYNPSSLFYNLDGCIFTLPGSRRDNHQFLYALSISKEDLIKILQLKSFW